MNTPSANRQSQRQNFRVRAESLGPLDTFWLDYLQSTRRWECVVSRDALHTELRDFWTRHNYSGPLPSRERLGSNLATHFKLGKMSGWPKYGKVQESDKRSNAWRFPTLDECQRVFEKATGV
jgi:hypothetical protein